jgi:hypothetical protein
METRFRLTSVGPTDNSLSTRDTTDKVVADLGIDSVGDTEEGHGDVGQVRRVLFLLETSRRRSWLRLAGERVYSLLGH